MRRPRPGRIRHTNLWKEVWSEEECLVMRKGARLPAHCVKTNQPVDRAIRQSLSWHPPAITLLIFLGVIPFLVAVLIVRKTATIYAGLSEEGLARRRRAIRHGWMGIFGSVLLMFGAPLLFAEFIESEQPEVMLTLMFTGVVALPISAVATMRARQVVTAKHIDDQFVWLKGVHPDYLAALPPFRRLAG